MPSSKAKHAQYMRDVWYPQNRVKQKAMVLRNKKAILVMLREIKMARGCADCGYKSHPAALDFDHKGDATKKFNVCTVSAAGAKQILVEMEKCDVVCANCHRIRTFERREQKRRGAVVAQLAHNQKVESAILSAATRIAG